MLLRSRANLRLERDRICPDHVHNRERKLRHGWDRESRSPAMAQKPEVRWVGNGNDVQHPGPRAPQAIKVFSATRTAQRIIAWQVVGCCISSPSVARSICWSNVCGHLLQRGWTNLLPQVLLWCIISVEVIQRIWKMNCGYHLHSASAPGA